MLELLAAPFALSLVLLTLHTYLGLHVLARGIIFVDLALAQIAALGASLAFWFGYDAHGFYAQLFAISATLIAALAFTQLRKMPNKTAREVTIGCVYVVSTAVSVLLLSQSSQGMEELKSLFNGNILWTDWSTVGTVAAIYGVIGVFFWFFRHAFHTVSFSENGHRFGWEFAFFASFAIVITVSVNMAGILLVFAYLIIPAFSATLLFKQLKNQLFAAWIGGTLCTFVGLIFAYWADLPVGATLVAVLGILPMLFITIKKITPNRV